MRSSMSLLFLMSFALVLSACNRAEPRANPDPVGTSAAAKRTVPAATLERVESNKVCMMNDHFMNAPQIPVRVDDKTYYGCCAMCEKRLREDAKTRSAVDPVTQQRVDKAQAVIGKLPSGKVIYFESEQSLRRYPTS